VLVELPSVTGKRWPLLKRSCSDPKLKPRILKATQRDLRRYRALRRSLNPIRRLIHQGGDTEERFSDQEDTNEHTHLLFKPHASPKPEDDDEDDGCINGDEDKLAEPTSWSALAYSSFLWWASAGEKDEAEIEEDELDQELLSDLGALAAKVADGYRYRDQDDEETEGQAEPERESGQGDAGAEEVHSPNESRKPPNNALLETAVIAYFHRLTKQLFEACSSALEANAADAEQDIEVDDENEPLAPDDDDRIVRISSDDLRRMGLDVWSRADREFLRDFVALWWGRGVEVHGMGVECCGVRIC
jgi:Domain of unknown function (DUF4484)